MFPRGLEDVSERFGGCFREVWRMFPRGLEDVSERFGGPRSVVAVFAVLTDATAARPSKH